MRRSDREISDTAEIISIIEKCAVMRLGMCLHGKPYIVPLNFGYEYGDGFAFYFHCAHEGKKLDIIAENPNVFIELDCSHSLAEAEKACGYGYYYESVTAEGTAGVITDMSEKKKALSLLMKRQTGKDFEFTDNEANAVTIVKITVSEIVGKARRKSQIITKG